MALNVQDVVRTALLPGYIVLSGPAIARGAMLIKNRVPVGTAIGCGCISLSVYFSFRTGDYYGTCLFDYVFFTRKIDHR
jgi:hypothetical protein